MELTTRGSLQLISKQQSSGSLGMFSIGSKRIGLGLLLRWKWPVGPGCEDCCAGPGTVDVLPGARFRRQSASFAEPPGGRLRDLDGCSDSSRRNATERAVAVGRHFFAVDGPARPVYNRVRLSHGTLKRLASWPLRDPLASRGGRHGRGLPGEG